MQKIFQHVDQFRCFTINLDASMATNLQVSSKLYSLATEVIRDGQ